MSIETMTKISSTTVGAGGSSTITFTGIPQDYTDLRITLSARGTENNYYTNFLMTFNGGGTSDYTFIRGIGISNGVSSDGPFTSQSSIYIGEANAATSVASSFCHFDIHIGNYTEPRFKGVSIDKSQTNSTATPYILGMTGAGWLNTAPITTITLSNTSGVFAQHSTATLYGIKNQTKVIGNSVKAVGGQISFDGTYVSHTFASSGTFIPTQTTLIDYLVVAGGGGGGNRVAGNGGGGGGGAGGLRTSVGLTQMLVNPSSYTVTVGAGGAINASGSNSSFSSITSSGGGYGGNNGTPFAGASGGSGGGSIRSDSGITVAGGSGNAGGYSPVEGYAGGSGSGPGGGGGGAGAVGANSGGSGGDGGIGVRSSLSGVSTYYAGGGGGAGSGIFGNVYGGGNGGLGGGGNGGGSQGLPSAGVPNTGGGGGGQQFYPNSTTGGAGGSGIVIIRYKG